MQQTEQSEDSVSLTSSRSSQPPTESLAVIEQELQRLERDNSTLRRQLDQASISSQQLRAQNSELRGSLAACQGKLREIQQSECERYELQLRLQELQGANELLNKALLLKTEEHQRAAILVERLQVEITVVVREKQALKLGREKEGQELDSLRKELAQREKEISCCQENSRRELAETQLLFVRLNQKLQAQTVQLQSLSSSNKQLIRQVQQLTRQAQWRLTEQAKQRQGERELSSLESRNKEAESELQGLRLELKLLKQSRQEESETILQLKQLFDQSRQKSLASAKAQLDESLALAEELRKARWALGECEARLRTVEQERLQLAESQTKEREEKCVAYRLLEQQEQQIRGLLAWKLQAKEEVRRFREGVGY